MRYATEIDGTLEELSTAGRKFTDAFGVTHPSKYLTLWDEAYKNSRGIYEITDGTVDDFEFSRTGATLAKVGNKAVETITTANIPLADIKARELQNLSSEISGVMQSRPSVDTGLGFFVFGSREDKDNFKEIWEGMIDDNLALDTAYDIDDNPHELSASDMKKIYKAIVKNGRNVCAAGRAKKKAIRDIDDNTGTVQEVRDALGI